MTCPTSTLFWMMVPPEGASTLQSLRASRAVCTLTCARSTCAWAFA